MELTIAISSGKGGTGKTFIASNVAAVLSDPFLSNNSNNEVSGNKIRYLDCDVEEPNGHLFLKPDIYDEEDVCCYHRL